MITSAYGYSEEELPECPTRGCGPVEVINTGGGHAGEVVCTGCGLVLNDRPIAYFAEEKRHFDDSAEDTRRTSAPAFESVPIDRKASESQSSRNAKNADQFQDACSNVDLLCNALFVPPAVRADALQAFGFLFNNIGSQRSLKEEIVDALKSVDAFNSTAALAAAALFVACRQRSFPRHQDEICNVQRTPVEPVRKLVSIMRKELPGSLPIFPVESFVRRFAEFAGLSEVETAAVLRMSKNWKRTKDFSGYRSEKLGAAGVLIALVYRTKHKQVTADVQDTCGETAGFSFDFVQGIVKRKRKLLLSNYARAFRQENSPKDPETSGATPAIGGPSLHGSRTENATEIDNGRKPAKPKRARKKAPAAVGTASRSRDTMASAPHAARDHAVAEVIVFSDDLDAKACPETPLRGRKRRRDGDAEDNTASESKKRARKD